MNMNLITLENNQDYIILSTIDFNNNKYLILANELDDKDLCIRKVIMSKDNKEVIVKLDSNEEFFEVLAMFNNLNRKDKNE